MSQSAAGVTILSQNIGIGDGPYSDAFSRLRTSTPEFAFDAQFTYNLLPLIYEPITAQSGATVAHDATNRCALMTFASTPTGGKAYLQSYEWVRYQPGRSQLAFVTCCFIETMANTLKFAGIGDGVNGIEFQLSNTTAQFVIYSGTNLGNQTATQANWNMDKLDGTGISGLTLDPTKTQIVVIDFQALYVGRVRVGFDIGGKIIFVHQFLCANVYAFPYIQDANLPIRCGMTCTGTVSTTMRFICSSVVSEGGEGNVGGYNFAIEGTGTAGNGVRAHIMSLRPKTTFNSIANRIKFVLETVNLTVTGANPVLWELVLGQAITGASYSDVAATYSSFEVSGGTISGSPALVIAGGYIASGSSFKESVAADTHNRYPITLDMAGAVRALGTLSILGTGISGTSTMRATPNWKEIR